MTTRPIPPRGLKGPCPVCNRQFDANPDQCPECPWVLWQRLNTVYQGELAAKEEMRLDNVAMLEALDFYSKPETYFGIGFLPDPPAGAFMEDFSETELGMKPGKRARQALGDEP